MRWENWSWALALGQIGKNLWIRRLGLMNPSASSERASEWVRCQCQLQTLWSQETRSVHFSSFASFSSFSSLGFFASFFSASQNDQQNYLIYVRLLAIIPLWVWLSNPQSSDSMGIHGRNRSQKPPKSVAVASSRHRGLDGKSLWQMPQKFGKKTIASINSKDVNIFDGHIQASCACTKLHPQTNQMNYPIMIGFDPPYFGIYWVCLKTGCPNKSNRIESWIEPHFSQWNCNVFVCPIFTRTHVSEYINNTL